MNPDEAKAHQIIDWMINSKPLVTPGESQQKISQALTQARKEGRIEGLREAAKMVDNHSTRYLEEIRNGKRQRIKGVSEGHARAHMITTAILHKAKEIEESKDGK